MKIKKTIPSLFRAVYTMNDRRRRHVHISWSRLFWFTLFVVFSFVFFTCFSFSAFGLLFGGTIHPVLVSKWRTPAMDIISDGTPVKTVSVREVVTFPDQALIFLDYPPSARLFAKEDFYCTYFSSNSSSEPRLGRPPVGTDTVDRKNQILWCPLPPRGFTVSVGLKSNGYILPAGPAHRWNSLVYAAMIDRDNTTIVFAKGLNLRPERLSNTSRFEFVYGWDVKRPKFFLQSDVLSIAQEIARCKTPLSVLRNSHQSNSIKVSIRVKGRGTLNSIASPELLHRGFELPVRKKQHEMCICTMLRNQAKFLREWIMYHGRIGVQRWFIYDNNSDEDIEHVIESLNFMNYKVSRHFWPWIKTQEAGFAHCAVRAREFCEWIGFIDVDEFFHLPSRFFLHDVLKNQSQYSNVGEVWVACYSFGPSGLKRIPHGGVTVGYTCRLAAPERHKSILRAEALNSTLVNVVHRFHLRDGWKYVNLDKGEMVINHYKYQVWDVFKEKFYRRVATYVADWQNDQNAGSKDRAPGLGTRAVEPLDWSSQFCEVRDTGLRNRVLRTLADRRTHLLPWQDEHELDKQDFDKRTRTRTRRRRARNALRH